MKSDTILQLLANKHFDDIFVPECKNGATQSAARGAMRRMDAWAMAKSWRHPCYTAYEIKVDRNDFLRDEKWPAYLQCSNQLYFVCPAKLISVGEVPEDAGLMWASTNGTRLFTKKKAPHRKIKDPIDTLLYILICRAQITRERNTSDSNIEYWRSWLAEKDEKRQLGMLVSKSLRDKYAQDVEKVRRENAGLKSEIENLARVQSLLEELGIAPSRWTSITELRNRLSEVERGLPGRLLQTLGDIGSRVDNLIEQIKACQIGKENVNDV
jgi:hypothetical protein